MGTGKTYSTKYLLDSNNSSGVAGQVLSTTSTGIDWVDANTVPGSGLWLESGNNIYNSNSGNVGIGVTDPQAKLEVKGPSASPADGNEVISVTNTTGGSKLLLGVAENQYGWIQSAEGGTYRNLLLNPLGGNVGIGTISPAQDFVVADATNGNGVELVPGTTATIQTYNRGTSAYTNLNIDTLETRVRSIGTTIFNNGSGFSESMRITSAGNVGIGGTGLDD